MLKFALQYESVAQFVREFPEKIATSGVYVKTDKPVEVGDPIGLLFRFRAEPESLTATGEVVWIDTEEEAKSGKKGLVVRNITLDAASQRAFNAQLKSSMKVAEPSYDEHPVQTVVMPPPAPAPAAPRPAPQMQAPAPAAAAAPKKKWPMIVGAVLGLLLVGSAVWYFALGGRDIIANMGIEYREGRVTKVDQVNGTFSLGLLNQVSSDWVIHTKPETLWIGVRGLNELRENDRVGLRYRLGDQQYEAVQVTVKERVMAGTIGSLIDKTKGVFNLQDSKLAGSVVEVTSEFNDQMRNLAAKLRPGDVVETIYAVGGDGKNMVQKIVVKERTTAGKIKAVDAGLQALAIVQEDGSEIKVTGIGQVEFTGVEGWAALTEQDEVRLVYNPETMQLAKVEMINKYVPPAPEPVKVKVAPRVMSDVMYNADAVVARFAFVFNRRPEYGNPQHASGPYERVMLRVPNSSSTYPKSEIFLSTGPLRTVRLTNEGKDLVITFLADKGVSPRCSFEREGDRIVAVCFKN
jgi:Tfp pilus assembly protein PilZ